MQVAIMHKHDGSPYAIAITGPDDLTRIFGTKSTITKINDELYHVVHPLSMERIIEVWIKTVATLDS